MKTDYMVISFDESGGAGAMHRDQFDLGFLGNQKIERASEIKFNESTQRWDIYLPRQNVGPSPTVYGWDTIPDAQGFETYDQARSAEVAWLEYCALTGVKPFSEEALSELTLARLAMAGGAKSFGPALA